MNDNYKYMSLNNLETYTEKMKKWCTETFLTADDIVSYGEEFYVQKIEPSYVTGHYSPYIEIHSTAAPKFNEIHDYLSKVDLRLNELEAESIRTINRINALQTDKEKFARFKDNRGLRSQLQIYDEWSGIDIYEVIK